MVKMNFLSKPVWKNFSDVKLCSFSLNKQGLGEISANVSHRRDNYYLTTLAAKDGKTLGTDSFGMYPEEKRMFDFDITTLPFFRGKFRLGELMRLISIMEMFENNLEFMELYSRETAINFHAKYGFRPDIKRFLHRDMTLKTISEDIRFEELSQKAKFLIDKVKSSTRGEELRNLCRLTSKLADEYLQKVKNLQIQEQKMFLFKEGFDMKLNKNDILQQKDRFNDLFEKHGIDYKI